MEHERLLLLTQMRRQFPTQAQSQKEKSSDSDTGKLLMSRSHPVEAEQLEADVPHLTAIAPMSLKLVPT